MTKLYHQVPEKMTGHILYPLNQLRSTHPELYALQLKKYEGRSDKHKEKIPFLNCLWNDAIHLTAVHPEKIISALREAGFISSKEKFYEIESKQLDPKKLIIYKHLSEDQDVSKDQFADSSKLRYYTKLRKSTIEYYKQKALDREKPHRYHFIPHILYKGTIDISRCKIITV